MSAADHGGYDAFIFGNTVEARAPLVPELRLRLATEVVPLWTRTEEIASGNLPPPYWAFAWPGGQALARYLLDHPETCRAARLLDFGAGSGLVAIAAAHAGANAAAADIDPRSAAAIRINAIGNGVKVDIIEEDVIGSDGQWDIICAGDMCYERPLAERLTAWLRERAGAGTRVFFGDPGRTYFPPTGRERLATYRVPTSLDLEDREMRETSVFRLLPS
jgi:predicted nicotinamide N-methyase